MACYAGRWPHIFFGVYPSLAEATASGTKLVASQTAPPRTPGTKSKPGPPTGRVLETWPAPHWRRTWSPAVGIRRS
jgi:hypothetical protein